MENKAKIIAAAAAVMNYLKTEEDMVMQSLAPAVPQQPQALPPVSYSPWALSGRQAQMQLRSMLQLKVMR
jgi:hypothetical protein